MGKRAKVQSGIYLIFSTKSMKAYVGYSIGIEYRWDDHKHHLRRNKHKNSHLQGAWNEYGEASFKFSVLEELPLSLSKEEFEAVETKWVLYYESHKPEKGYNLVMPGTKPNKDRAPKVREIVVVIKPIIGLNCLTGEKREFINAKEASDSLGLKRGKIDSALNYWTKKEKHPRKKVGNWVFVRKENYVEGFDYINFKKPVDNSTRIYTKKPPKERVYKKAPENIIPYSERNIKRLKIRMLHTETGEERIEFGLQTIAKKYGFSLTKLNYCLKAPFKQRKHHGWWFEKIV